MQILRKNINLNNNYQNYVFIADRNPLSNNFSLINSAGERIEVSQSYLSRTNCGQDKYTILKFDNIPNGKYDILSNADKISEVQINTKSYKESKFFDNKASIDDVEIALKDYEVHLQPGDYVFNRNLRLPDDFILIGYGARIIRKANNDPSNRIFTGGNNGTIIGLIFENAGYVFHIWPEVVTGLTLIDCTIINGNLGTSYIDCLIQGCTFDGAECLYGLQGIYLDCKWSNTYGNAFNLFGPCIGGLAMIDCEFDGTDRGPIFNTNSGSVTDNFFLNIVCRNINGGNNCNEIFMCEGIYEYSRNTHIHIRVFNCDSNCFQFSSIAKDNLIIDINIDGGGGFWLVGVNDVEQSGNIFDTFELRRCGITLGWQDGFGTIHGNGIINNVFRNGAVIDYQPSKVNQTDYDKKYYERNVAALALSPDFGMKNNLENVSIIVQANMIPYQNINGEMINVK